MQRETLASLADIDRAGQLIHEAVGDLSLEDYLTNWEKQSAVERQLIVIGEALTRIRNSEPNVFDGIPDAVKVVGLRNLLVHGYDAVDATTIFGLVGEPLAELSRSVRSLLSPKDQ